jgi:hypothetical protein
MTEMLSYRAYFITASDHIRHVTAFESTDDASAGAQAESMLAHSEYAAIEIYQGWRLIHRRERQQQTLQRMEKTDAATSAALGTV